MIKIGGKEYLNLQEAVLENALDIAILKQMTGYNGPYESLNDITDPVVKALYLVGAEVPYEIYQYNGSTYDYLGTFAANGAKGPEGPIGPQGPQGIPGEQGIKGDTGLVDAFAKDAASITAVGQAYVDENGYLQVCTSLNPLTFEQSGYIKGPQGEIGPVGPQGIQGEIGPAGPKGEQGDVGPQGPQGPQGEQGPAGKDGKDGKDGTTSITVNGSTYEQVEGNITIPDYPTSLEWNNIENKPNVVTTDTNQDIIANKKFSQSSDKSLTITGDGSIYANIKINDSTYSTSIDGSQIYIRGDNTNIWIDPIRAHISIGDNIKNGTLFLNASSIWYSRDNSNDSNIFSIHYYDPTTETRTGMHTFNPNKSGEVAVVSEIPDTSNFVTNTDLDTTLGDYELKSEAFSGDYNDLTNKPVIPVVDYPVTSVNSKTGDVVLAAADINAKDNNTVQANIDRIDSNVSVAQTNIANISNDITRIDSSISSIDTNITNINSELVRIENKIPIMYLKNADVTGNTLYILKSDGTSVQFEGGGGSSAVSPYVQCEYNNGKLIFTYNNGEGTKYTAVSNKITINGTNYTWSGLSATIDIDTTARGWNVKVVSDVIPPGGTIYSAYIVNPTFVDNFATTDQIPTDYVSISGNQTINGKKTFNGGVTAANFTAQGSNQSTIYGGTQFVHTFADNTKLNLQFPVKSGNKTIATTDDIPKYYKHYITLGRDDETKCVAQIELITTSSTKMDYAAVVAWMKDNAPGESTAIGCTGMRLDKTGLVRFVAISAYKFASGDYVRVQWYNPFTAEITPMNANKLITSSVHELK